MAAKAKSGTLTASTVATVPLTDVDGVVNVVNRSQSGTIWVRFDGVDPTVAGDECFPVLGVRSFRAASGTASVKLIASEALDYTVERGRG